MRFLVTIVLFLIVAPATTTAQTVGSLEIAGRVKIGAANERLKRKRFYLFRGGLTANRALVDKLKSAPPVPTRDCFYCTMKASPEYVAWLKAEDCESPYCRAISADDVAKVPEFKSAYTAGLQKFRNKPDLAREWLTTNMPSALRDGYYLRRKSLTDTLLAGVKPLQTAMTDSVTVVAPFIDIPLDSAAGETFMVTNVVPFEVSGKTYLWACEIAVNDKKKAKLSLNLNAAGKPAAKCEVVIRDAPACTAGSCG